MKNNNLLRLTFICLITLISSCSIQKRTYRSGYHVEWNKNYTSANSKESSEQNAIANNDYEHSEEQTYSTIPIENEIIVSSDLAINEIESEMNFQSELISATEVKDENRILPINIIDIKKDIEQNKIESGTISSTKIISNKSNKSSNAAANGGKLQIVALILCILFGVIGVHRFYLGYSGLGVLYLLTFGLFGIGWLIDLILLIIPNGLTPKGRSNYKE